MRCSTALLQNSMQHSIPCWHAATGRNYCKLHGKSLCQSMHHNCYCCHCQYFSFAMIHPCHSFTCVIVNFMPLPRLVDNLHKARTRRNPTMTRDVLWTSNVGSQEGPSKMLGIFPTSNQLCKDLTMTSFNSQQTLTFQEHMEKCKAVRMEWTNPLLSGALIVFGLFAKAPQTVFNRNRNYNLFRMLTSMHQKAEAPLIFLVFATRTRWNDRVVFIFSWLCSKAFTWFDNLQRITSWRQLLLVIDDEEEQMNCCIVPLWNARTDNHSHALARTIKMFFSVGHFLSFDGNCHWTLSPTKALIFAWHLKMKSHVQLMWKMRVSRDACLFSSGCMHNFSFVWLLDCHVVSTKKLSMLKKCGLTDAITLEQHETDLVTPRPQLFSVWDLFDWHQHDWCCWIFFACGAAGNDSLVDLHQKELQHHWLLSKKTLKGDHGVTHHEWNPTDVAATGSTAVVEQDFKRGLQRDLPRVETHWWHAHWINCSVFMQEEVRELSVAAEPMDNHQTAIALSQDGALRQAWALWCENLVWGVRCSHVERQIHDWIDHDL